MNIFPIAVEVHIEGGGGVCTEAGGGLEGVGAGAGDLNENGAGAGGVLGAGAGVGGGGGGVGWTGGVETTSIELNAIKVPPGTSDGNGIRLPELSMRFPVTVVVPLLPVTM